MWLPVLGGDSRAAWDDTVIPDPRVTQLYDAERIAGGWFAQHGHLVGDFVWDIALLYGPAATWDEAPGPLIHAGGDIIDDAPALRDQLQPLLK